MAKAGPSNPFPLQRKCALIAIGAALAWPAAAAPEPVSAGPTATVPSAPAASEQSISPQGEQLREGLPQAAVSHGAARPAHRGSPFRPTRLTERAKEYYAALWGVDRLKVVETASGNLIRFSYRVADPERAKVLGDKGATPYLISQRSGAMLQIPIMDKVGALRQTGAPIAGQEYWMTFSNKGNHVKAGDRVNVIIGSFHADGLAVE